MMGMMGDIDGDNKIDVSDLELLKQVLKEGGHLESLLDRLSPEERARLDVNRDGQINHEDTVKLYQILLQGPAPEAEALADRFIALRQKTRS